MAVLKIVLNFILICCSIPMLIVGFLWGVIATFMEQAYVDGRIMHDAVFEWITGKKL